MKPQRHGVPMNRGTEKATPLLIVINTSCLGGYSSVDARILENKILIGKINGFTKRNFNTINRDCCCKLCMK